MMTIRELINRDLLAEKMSGSKDKYYVQNGNRILGDLKNLDHKTFISTGRIMTENRLKQRYPNTKLTKGTKTVCKYIGGFCIEFLENGKFGWAWHEDVDINHVEYSLFNYVKQSIDEQG